MDHGLPPSGQESRGRESEVAGLKKDLIRNSVFVKIHLHCVMQISKVEITIPLSEEINLVSDE